MSETNSPKNQIKDLHNRLPKDLTWDDIMASIVSTRINHRESIEKNTPKNAIKNIIDGLPRNSSWDEAIGLIIAAKYKAQKLENISNNVSNFRSIGDDHWRNEKIIGTAAPDEEQNGKDHHEVKKQSLLELIQLLIVLFVQKAAERLAQNKRAAKILKYSAFLVIIMGFAALGWWESRTPQLPGWQLVLFFILFIAVLKVSLELHKKGRYFIQESGREGTNTDLRPPVVYLRAFRDDLIAGETKILALTEEEQLVRVLSDIGPVTALDNPSKLAKAPGAFRLQAFNKEWQERVRYLISKSNLVVIRVAMTPALIWELDLVRKIVDPAKILLIIPSEDYLKYEGFLKYAKHNLNIDLPELKKEGNYIKNICRILTRTPRFGHHFSFETFIHFDHQWRGYSCYPTFSFNSFFRSPLTGYGEASIRYALKPVFKNLDIPWEKPPLNFLTAIVVLIFVCSAVVGIAGYR